jgi:hypothetical protein
VVAPNEARDAGRARVRVRTNVTSASTIQYCQIGPGSPSNQMAHCAVPIRMWAGRGPRTR